MLDLKIRTVRKAKGITASFIARQLGISPRHYWKIETGWRGMRASAAMTAKVALILNVPMEELIEVDA